MLHIYFYVYKTTLLQLLEQKNFKSIFDIINDRGEGARLTGRRELIDWKTLLFFSDYFLAIYDIFPSVNRIYITVEREQATEQTRIYRLEEKRYRRVPSSQVTTFLDG